MGKTLSSILNIVTSPLSIIDKDLGNLVSGAALVAIGVATGNPALIALGLSRFTAGVQGLLSNSKPATTETAIKVSRPPRVSAYGTSRLYGAYICYETAEDGTAVDVFAVHDGEITAIVARYLGDTAVTLAGTAVQEGDDERFANDKVHFYTTTGVVPGTAIAPVVALLPGVWTNNHRGDGVVILAVTFESVKDKDFVKTYPNGAVVASIAAQWQKCPDLSAVDPLDESGWTWTENGVRQLAHYKLVREGPRPAIPRSDPGYAAELAALRAAWWARKIAPTIDYWIAAQDVCDEARALNAGGTEAKYRSCVAHKHTDQHQGPITALLATFDGWISPRADGALIVYAGKFYEPTVAITPDEIVSYSFENGEPDEGEAVNEIVCSYVSSLHEYNTVECDAWRDETNIADRGKVLSVPLDLQVPSHAQVRFLAKRLMQRKSARQRGSITTNIAGRVVLGERFVDLHLEEAGTVFYSGPVEIVAARRVLRGGVSFEWVAADANVDNWNPATEEGAPATLGDRVTLAPLVAPVIDDAVPQVDGETIFVALEITAPDRDDLQWFARWRLDGASVWGAEFEFTDVAPGATVELLVGPVPVDSDLEIQVAYRVGDGRFSPWSDAFEVPTGEIIYDGGGP